MDNKKFRAYYNEQKLQGRSDSQIARSLGMSLAHMVGLLNGVDVDKVDPPKKKEAKKFKEKVGSNDAVAEKPIQKKEEPKQEEDLSWMND